MKQELSFIVNAEVSNQIERVSNSFPSLFTKDDVQTILRDLLFNVTEQMEAIPDIKERSGIYSLDALQELRGKVQEAIWEVSHDSSDIVDYDSAEFEIEYNNKLTLNHVEINTDTINESVEEIIMPIIDKYIDAAKEVINQQEQEAETTNQ